MRTRKMMTSKQLRALAIFIITISAFIGGIVLATKMIKIQHDGSITDIYNQKTDTIISKSILKKLKPYDYETKPKTITIYKPNIIRVDTCYLKGDTVRLETENGKIDYNQSFLTTFPDANKLIDFKIKGKDLSLSLITPKGVSLTQLFNIDPLHYNYVYVDNKLTLEPNDKWYYNLSLYGQIIIKPLVNIYNLDIGINYKTKIFIIDGGGSFYYIPQFQKPFNLTPYLGIRYNLQWPRR